MLLTRLLFFSVSPTLTKPLFLVTFITVSSHIVQFFPPFFTTCCVFAEVSPAPLSRINFKHFFFSVSLFSGKVNMSLPPGVTSLVPHQYMLGNHPPSLPPAFYGLQQPQAQAAASMYAAAYTGLEDLAALQQRSLHTLVGAAAAAAGQQQQQQQQQQQAAVQQAAAAAAAKSQNAGVKRKNENKQEARESSFFTYLLLDVVLWKTIAMEILSLLL